MLSDLQLATCRLKYRQETMEMAIVLPLVILVAFVYDVEAVCKDNNVNCATWAGKGECKKNPTWMLKNCRKSCDNCVAPVCKDKNAVDCPDWEAAGFCAKTSEWYGFMKDNCPKSCKFCGGDNILDEIKTKTLKPTSKPTPKPCKDEETDCADWKSGGFCANTSEFFIFMKKTCAKSCGFCTEPKKEDDCKDNYNSKDCKKWADNGECGKNPTWMHENCKKSCNKCENVKPETTDPSATEINGNYCGLRIKARVVGGKDASLGDWPWQVGIARAVSPNGVFCGGSLINKHWVVTAAHCFGRPGYTKYQPGDLVVRVGDNDLGSVEGTEVVLKVVKIIRHEEYKIGSYSNDITLLKLEKPLTYNTYIKPVCLPASGKDEKIDQQCSVTGWGKVAEHGKTSRILQEAKLPIISRDICKLALDATAPFTDVMICAGYAKGGIDACQGDSGGPFVCLNGGRFELTGIVSWGRGCARANSYGVYVKVSKYINWIKENIKK